MEYVKLGSTNLKVSRVCLGTMTWGKQNNQQDANEQLAYALDQGINFMDTAEMYAVPPSAETYGATETIIGNWLADNQHRREDFILATKIAGSGVPWIRNGGEISGKAVKTAVDHSLERLQTDYIDLYQLHWPNRTSPHFSKHWPGKISFDINAEQHIDQMHDILNGLAECVSAGKIRHCGLSDDTPWGIQQYMRLAELHDLPKMVSIQNEFSLLHLKDWPYLIETCVHNDIAYLPWSPLAGGALSGKYLNGARPPGSRWTLSQRMGIFRDNPQVDRAIGEYVAVANQAGITPSQLALAWCAQVEGVTSTIIGATSMAQLQQDIDAFNISLSQETLDAVDTVIRKYPVPF